MVLCCLSTRTNYFCCAPEKLDFSKDHSFHTGTIKTVPQKNFVPIFTQELFRVTIYERVTFLQNIVCLFSHRNYKNSSSG